MNTPQSPAEEERLSAAVRVNLLPAELTRLQRIAQAEERPVAAIVRRSLREMFERMDRMSQP